ncbi:MAG TPA: nuclear transport factor 2 family protein [Pyrinomonadaceae bacterium]
MKTWTLLVSLVVSTLLAAQIGCQQVASNANRAALENTNSSTAKPVDTAAIEKELLQLEHDWATAAVTHSADAVKRVEADDIIVTYIDGSTGTKADDVRDIETGALTAEAWDLADVQVKVLDADAAVVTGRGIIKNGKYKGPDGRIEALKSDYRFTDVFARRNGQWQAIASQTSTILNPPPSPSPTLKASPSPTGSPIVSPSLTATPR